MTRDHLIEKALTHSIIGCFYDVHRELGFGYREVIYSLALEVALGDKGHSVEREVPTVVYFRGRALARQVLDMIVDDTVVLEIKSAHTQERHACRQLHSYLWGTRFEVGLVLRFGYRATFYRLVCENRLKSHQGPLARSGPSTPIAPTMDGNGYGAR